MSGMRNALRVGGLLLAGCLLVAAIGIAGFAAAVGLGAGWGYSRSDGLMLLGLAAFVAAGGLAAIAVAVLVSEESEPAQRGHPSRLGSR